MCAPLGAGDTAMSDMYSLHWKESAKLKTQFHSGFNPGCVHTAEILTRVSKTVCLNIFNKTFFVTANKKIKHVSLDEWFEDNTSNKQQQET